MMPTLTKFWSKKKVTLIDRAMTIAAVIHPLMAAPQVYEIFKHQNASGVSLWTWSGFLVIGLVFLAYGFAHRLTPFIINQIIWFVLDLLVIIGILIYK